MSYDFTITLQRPDGPGEIKIDPKALYGYWERRDGSEGGGLWFAHVDDGKMELVDFDGAYELPATCVKLLRDAGYVLDSCFDA